MKLLLVAQVAALSPGCAAPLGPGRRQNQVVSVGERGAVERSFLLTVPQGAGPFPVLFAFHGYTNTAAEIANEHHFDAIAEAEGVVIVYAEGMRDGPQGGSWNIGPQTAATCDEPKYTACYQSCGSECGSCAWHTCVDDLAFADALVTAVGAATCVDTTRLYLYGESAGAMLVYRLLRERPGVFAAAAPEQGLPYQGASTSSRTAILHLHDRQDKVVPILGGRSDDGWLYSSLPATMQGACGADGTAPYTTSLPKVTCTEYLRCRGGPVVSCLYDGEHGNLPDGVRLKDGAEQAGLSDEFIWDFLKQFRTGTELGRAGWNPLVIGGFLASVFVSGAMLMPRRDPGEATTLLVK